MARPDDLPSPLRSMSPLSSVPSSPNSDPPLLNDEILESQSQPSAADSGSHFDALKRAMGTKVHLLNDLPFDRVRLIQHSDDEYLVKQPLAPLKLTIGTTKDFNEPIFAYPMRSVGGTHPLGTLAVSFLSFSAEKQKFTMLKLPNVIDANLNNEYAGVTEENELKALIKLYFIQSGICDQIHVPMSKRLVADIESACETFAKSKVNKAETKNLETSSIIDILTDLSTPTRFVAPNFPADDHRAVQPSLETPTPGPSRIAATRIVPMSRASSASTLAHPGATPMNQTPSWLDAYKKEYEEPLATTSAIIRNTDSEIATWKTKLHSVREIHENDQAPERLQLLKSHKMAHASREKAHANCETAHADREKAHAAFLQADAIFTKADETLVKADADLARANRDLAEADATLMKKIEDARNELRKKIEGARQVREREREKGRRLQRLKAEKDAEMEAAYKGMSTRWYDEPAAKRTRRV